MLGVLNFLNKPLTIRWYLLNPYITTHSRSGSAAVRGLFVVFHRGISTYRSAATVQNRGVCFLLLNYGGQKTI